MYQTDKYDDFREGTSAWLCHIIIIGNSIIIMMVSWPTYLSQWIFQYLKRQSLYWKGRPEMNLQSIAYFRYKFISLPYLVHSCDHLPPLSLPPHPLWCGPWFPYHVPQDAHRALAVHPCALVTSQAHRLIPQTVVWQVVWRKIISMGWHYGNLAILH